MQRVKFTLIGLVVVLAALVAYGYGCGGDDGTSGGGDSTAAESSPSTGDGTEAADGGKSDGGADGTEADGTEGDGSEADGTPSDSDGTTSGGDGADGDGDSTASGSGSSGKPLTKKEFIKQGDAICQKVPQRYNELVQKLEKESKGKKPSTAETNLAAAVPPIPEAAKEFEELTPPKGDEQKAEAIIAALEAAATGLEAKPSSELSGPKSPFAEFQKLTREYGFTFCSAL